MSAANGARLTTRYGYTPIDEQFYEQYFAALEESGSYAAAADAVNWSVHAVIKHRKMTPEFQETCDRALDRYRTRIIAAAHRRAVDGYDVPVIGGRNRDEIVAVERRYSDNLMGMFLKRSDPEGFRDRSEVKTKISGAVEFREAVKYASLSKRARDKLRELLEICKEDEARRLRGETVE